MPYYAVGFGTYGYKCGITSVNDKGQKMFTPTACIDGSFAKVAGPFRKSQQAWRVAAQLQAGASMMASTPFIFKYGMGLKLSSLVHMIDYDQYEIKEEYAGKHCVHKIRFKRDYDFERESDWDRLHSWGYHCPQSLVARRRLINKEKRAKKSL